MQLRTQGSSVIAMETERRKKILIVDNNERILATFQKVLENAGFDTHTTWSGHEALALLQSSEFDCASCG